MQTTALHHQTPKQVIVDLNVYQAREVVGLVDTMLSDGYRVAEWTEHRIVFVR